MDIFNAHSIPLLLLAVITPVLATLSVEVGFRIGRMRSFRNKDVPSISGLVQATLGLLAFMLAFSFGMAQSHYKDRKEMVLEEANNIGTVFLRAGFVKQPQQEQIKKLLFEFVEHRLEANGHPEKIHQSIVASNKALDRLWLEALEIGKKDQYSITNGLFIESLNNLIDTSAKRIKARLHSQISITIWIVLYLLLGLAMASMGYQTGLSGKRIFPAYIFVIISFSVVMYLIGDLDQPQAGIINVGQNDIVDLYNTIAGSAEK